MKSLLFVASSVMMLLVNSAAAADDFSQSTSSGESSDSRVPVPTQPLTPECQWETTDKGTMYSDLGHFTLDGADVQSNPKNPHDVTFKVAPCRSQMICSNRVTTSPVYAASVNENGECVDAYTVVKQAVTFESRSPARYTEVLQTANLSKSLTLIFQCDQKANGTQGVVTETIDGVSGDLTLTVSSYKVCPSPIQKVIPVPVDQCSVDFTQFNGKFYQASMPQFSQMGNTTIDSQQVAIGLCDPPMNFAEIAKLSGDFWATPCQETGYMAYMQGGTCVVLDQRTVTYDPNLLQFTAVFNSSSAASSASDVSSSRVVVLKCGAENSTTATLEGGNTVTYTSTGACGNVTAAPVQPVPAKTDVAALEVVGIVILCVGFLVVMVGLCLWKNSESGEDSARIRDGRELNKYERV